MAGHSHSKNGVALLAYVLAIHDFAFTKASKVWITGVSPAMTIRNSQRFSIYKEKNDLSIFSLQRHR
jgi:hypothetical protein